MKHKATRYTIRTEATGDMANQAIALAKVYFKGFTVQRQTGYWEGERELSLSIIIIDTPGNVIPIPSLEHHPCSTYVTWLAAAIARTNDQDAVLVEEEGISYEFI